MILNELESKPEITFEFHPEAEHLKAGMVCDHLYAYENGNKVGYLKIDRIDKELFNKECPDVWAFMQEYQGKHLFSNPETPIADKPFDELVKALRSGFMHRYTNYWCKQMKWNEEDSKIIDSISNDYRSSPDEWAKYKDVVVRFFTEWPKKTQDGRKVVKDMKNKVEYFSKPFVAYINTKENKHQGLVSDNSKRGIGAMLYLTGAKWIKDRGLAAGLYASSLQSDDAKAVWKKFERDGRVVQDGDRKYLNP
ncbi:MAG: hypothetical protein M0R77_02850 [Gammaproteobacteria bacterium]|nr:hypothetical protein [Gammaproteobacteria bacterium]